MRSILHILTRPEDELTRTLLEGQRALPDTRVEIANLTVPQPDYDALVERIFSADSIEVW